VEKIRRLVLRYDRSLKIYRVSAREFIFQFVKFRKHWISVGNRDYHHLSQNETAPGQ
jgi:hypothetical protein